MVRPAANTQVPIQAQAVSQTDTTTKMKVGEDKLGGESNNKTAALSLLKTRGRNFKMLPKTKFKFDSDG